MGKNSRKNLIERIENLEMVVSHLDWVVINLVFDVMTTMEEVKKLRREFNEAT